MGLERWWTLPHDVLAGLLARAANGEDPDALLVELYANSDTERPSADDPTTAADRLREWLTDYDSIAAVRAADDGGERLAFAADLRAVLDELEATR